MRHRSVILILTAALILAICPAGRADSAVQTAAIRYVAPGGADSGGCTDKGHPCGTAQYAVDQAANGDEIRVAAGEYAVSTGPVADLYVGLTLRGGFSTSNWSTADKIANPTVFKVSGDWDTAAAILAGALELVTIQDLDLEGGGIRSSGPLVVARVTVQDGQIRHSAGANTAVTLTDVAISGGNFVHAAGAGSMATLTRVTITASPEVGIDEKSGGGMAVSDAEITDCAEAGVRLANGAYTSTISGTLIAENGVGIDSASGGVLVLSEVTVRDNLGRGVIDRSAGMAMNDVTITGNHAIRDVANDDDGHGGGIYTQGRWLTLTGVEISGNVADGSGGGLYDASGGLELAGCTLAENEADGAGGGLWSSGTITVTAGAVTGNQAPAGGGIYCAGCNLSMTNSAATANTTDGIAVEGGSLTLLNTLVAGNTGVGLRLDAASRADTRLDNSLLALNSAGNGAGAGALAGTHNLVDDASCTFSATPNWTSTDARLGSLHMDGFYGLAAGSPAVDQANPATCPPVDHRGVARPIDGDRNGLAVGDVGPLEARITVFLPLVSR